ncbi:hypothetical protein Tco_0952836 [Tanacetum coccineum]|uniref:Uncharacterized protein n=1 Tax=Tanacetum coccineum TaxID=301880 RepID=A0ABQ5DY45_9ASTR
MFRSMSPSVTPVRRCGNPASGYESYMLAAHSELSYSTQWNVPKPLGKLGPPGLTIVQSHSETVYLRPICQPSDISLCLPALSILNHNINILSVLLLYRSLGAAVELSPASYLSAGAVRHNLLRGGSSASGVSSLQSTGVKCGMMVEVVFGGKESEGSGDDSVVSGMELEWVRVPHSVFNASATWPKEQVIIGTQKSQPEYSSAPPPPRHLPRPQRAPHPHPLVISTSSSKGSVIIHPLHGNRLLVSFPKIPPGSESVVDRCVGNLRDDAEDMKLNQKLDMNELQYILPTFACDDVLRPAAHAEFDMEKGICWFTAVTPVRATYALLDIITKTEKPSLDDKTDEHGKGRRLCKIKAKVQKCLSPESITEESAVKTRGGTEEYY